MGRIGEAAPVIPIDWSLLVRADCLVDATVELVNQCLFKSEVLLEGVDRRF